MPSHKVIVDRTFELRDSETGVTTKLDLRMFRENGGGSLSVIVTERSNESGHSLGYFRRTLFNEIAEKFKVSRDGFSYFEHYPEIPGQRPYEKFLRVTPRELGQDGQDIELREPKYQQSRDESGLEGAIRRIREAFSPKKEAPEPEPRGTSREERLTFSTPAIPRAEMLSLGFEAQYLEPIGPRTSYSESHPNLKQEDLTDSSEALSRKIADQTKAELEQQKSQEQSIEL